MYKRILIFFTLLFANILYASNPCNENISQKDKDSFKALELNPPLFQCSFKQEKVMWQYNQTLQKDYDATLKELQSNFPTLSLSQAKGLRYALYIQDSLNTIKKNENTNNKNPFGKILGSATFTQKNIDNMQGAIDFYYQQSIPSLNIHERERLYLKLYGELEAIKIEQRAEDFQPISKEEIFKSQLDNKKILQQIKDITQLSFGSENEEILYVDMVNNLAFIYNANLLINEGKDYKERKYRAYNENKNALELLELLYLFTQKIQNKENQFISLQGSLITIQGAIMSIPIHTPFTKEDYERIKNREELKYLLRIIQKSSFQSMTKNLERLVSQTSNATYSQKQAIMQKTFVKVDSVLKTLILLDSRKGIMHSIALLVEYENKYLDKEK
ncbi:hypothetical protein [Helicobacter ganmani]|uniref:hypothetical protein n=1 Tax=Helicobacter ganmani TaxID=60246 RepID=UPI003A86160A